MNYKDKTSKIHNGITAIGVVGLLTSAVFLYQDKISTGQLFFMMSMALLLLNVAVLALDGLFRYLSQKKSVTLGFSKINTLVNKDIPSNVSFLQLIVTSIIFTLFSCVLVTMIYLITITSTASKQTIELSEVTGVLDKYHYRTEKRGTIITFILKDGSVYNTDQISLGNTINIFNKNSRNVTIFFNKNKKPQKDGSVTILGLLVNDHVVISHKEVLHEFRRSNEIAAKIFIFFTICITPVILCILIPCWKDYIWKYIKSRF